MSALIQLLAQKKWLMPGVLALLDPPSVRSMRASCRGSGAPFDYAGLGLGCTGGPKDDQVLGLLMVDANDELSMHDVALLRIATICLLRLDDEGYENSDKFCVGDDLYLHIFNDAKKQLIKIYRWDSSAVRRGSRYVWEFERALADRSVDRHEEATCPCWVCRTVRGTIRRGYAAMCTHRGIPPIRAGRVDPVREFFRLNA